jgi:hypothetical protein
MWDHSTRADVGRRQPISRVNRTKNGNPLNLSVAFVDVESLSMRRMSASTARRLSVVSTDSIPEMLITKQRKAKTMVNQTPLRLVAIGERPPAEDDGSADPITERDLVVIEERPPAEDDGSANPVTMMTEHDAITRKVPDPGSIAAWDSFPDNPKRFPRWQTLLPIAAVGVVIGVAIVALATKGKITPTPAPASATATPVRGAEEPSQPQPSLARPAPAAASPSQTRAVHDTIRIAITAEPREAELSLDGNLLAGRRLNLEVPKDRGIHVVSASAPGYVPFNQQVSFSSDVVLNISLHRAQSTPVRQVARPRPSQREPRPQSSVRPAAVQPGPGIEPGMNLDGPSMRHKAKPIDERNPYKP